MISTASIILSRPGSSPERRSVTGSGMTLGRDPGCDWQLPSDKEISKKHCVIEINDGKWSVRDLSTNGTFLNSEGLPIGRNQSRPLRHGDRIWIGSYEIEVQLDSVAGSRFQEPGNVHISAAAPIGDDWDFNAPPTGSQWNDHSPSPAWDHDPASVEGVVLPQVPEAAIPDNWHDADNDIAPQQATADTIGRATKEPPAIQKNALAELLDGAELPIELAARAIKNPDATLKTAGQVLRAVVSGLRALLFARTGVKQVYRIEVTVVGNNANALKFSPTDEMALAALLDPKRMSLRDVEEVIKDLKTHQIATSEATQAAARTLLAQLAPATLEAEDIAGLQFPGLREKRLWEAYKKQHASMVEQFEDNFKSEFYTAFALAYEQATGKRKKAKL